MKSLGITLGLSLTFGLGCGGRLDADSSAEDGQGNASSSAGGNSAGGAAGTGGVNELDASCPAYVGKVCARISTVVIGEASSLICDIPLGLTPVSPNVISVTVDCTRVPLIPNNDPDAGTMNGFFVDYYRTPAHAVLLSAGCQLLQSPGTHQVDIVVGCSDP